MLQLMGPQIPLYLFWMALPRIGRVPDPKHPLAGKDSKLCRAVWERRLRGRWQACVWMEEGLGVLQRKNPRAAPVSQAFRKELSHPYLPYCPRSCAGAQTPRCGSFPEGWMGHWSGCCSWWSSSFWGWRGCGVHVFPMGKLACPCQSPVPCCLLVHSDWLLCATWVGQWLLPAVPRLHTLPRGTNICSR